MARVVVKEMFSEMRCEPEMDEVYQQRRADLKEVQEKIVLYQQDGRLRRACKSDYRATGERVKQIQLAIHNRRKLLKAFGPLNPVTFQFETRIESYRFSSVPDWEHVVIMQGRGNESIAGTYKRSSLRSSKHLPSEVLPMVAMAQPIFDGLEVWERIYATDPLLVGRFGRWKHGRAREFYILATWGLEGQTPSPRQPEPGIVNSITYHLRSSSSMQ